MIVIGGGRGGALLAAAAGRSATGWPLAPHPVGVPPESILPAARSPPQRDCQPVAPPHPPPRDCAGRCQLAALPPLTSWPLWRPALPSPSSRPLDTAKHLQDAAAT